MRLGVATRWLVLLVRLGVATRWLVLVRLGVATRWLVLVRLVLLETPVRLVPRTFVLP